MISPSIKQELHGLKLRMDLNRWLKDLLQKFLPLILLDRLDQIRPQRGTHARDGVTLQTLPFYKRLHPLNERLRSGLALRKSRADLGEIRELPGEIDVLSLRRFLPGKLDVGNLGDVTDERAELLLGQRRADRWHEIRRIAVQELGVGFENRLLQIVGIGAKLMDRARFGVPHFAGSPGKSDEGGANQLYAVEAVARGAVVAVQDSPSVPY